MSTPSARNTLAKGISVALVLTVALTGAYFLYEKSFKGVQETAGATKDGAIDAVERGIEIVKRNAKAVRRALGFEPRVTVGTNTVFGPSTELTEIVTASKTFEHTYIYEVAWAGSTKRLELKGDFTAKAGFAVDESFSIDFSPDGKAVTLRHQQPKLISCEMSKIHVLKDENGWWNKIDPSERETAQNILLEQARAKASGSDIMTAATRNLLQRLAPLQTQQSLTVSDESRPLP
ncbi:DUF4230 domain-containing protein [Prosthecobacter sp.]|jgi:hypothetical protein|uniref:DUF4230 domain-containing protein n=1 Tax=Prosthecobacter sp. TaxID=1965333 RepID=UPI0037C621A2